MHKYIIITLLLLSAVMLPALVVETGSLRNFIYGDEPACAYDNWISHLAEKIVSPGYNVYSPWDRQTTGFGNFQIPTTTQMNNWGVIIDEFLLQNWDNVEALISSSGFPYQLIQFNDTESGRTYYMLRENINTQIDDNGTLLDSYDDEYGAFSWGWGLYIFNPEGDSRTLITVPHPCDDFMAPVIGFVALNTLNAQYLMIAGAGREVAWTNEAPYANSKSLSDPTRVTNHPWYPAYTRFSNKIRQTTGKREFSLQIHTYDSATHQGFSSIQLSAGYQRYCPNLPIRDLSRFRHDLLNETEYLMIPQNTIGNHSNVYVNDYYTVQYATHPFTYSDGQTTVDINNYMDLGAYSQNVQMNYTLSGWNDYDVFEPFFHAEMDELPNCYTQNDNTYNWFWGWNDSTQRWDMDHLFDRAIDYYSIWVNDLNEVLGDALAMNDNSSPQPPGNLTVFNQAYNYVTLKWHKANDYDFDTYEILYGTEPIGLSNFSIFSRNQDSYLASPYCDQINVIGLSTATQYYFKIRAKDKNGNYSELSNEASVITSPVNIFNYRGIGYDNYVKVKWDIGNQANNHGFRIYRKVNNGEFSLADSYLTNSYLVGGLTNYEWTDNIFVINDQAYTYKIASVDSNNVEFIHNVTTTCYPRDYYTLRISNQDATITDSLSFSANPNASYGNDADYEIGKATNPPLGYVWGAFWEQYWGQNGTYLQQEVYGDFDKNVEVRTWSIRVRSDQINTPLTFSVDDSYGRYTEKLFLRDNSSGIMTNLNEGSYTFQVVDTNLKNFTLYWGNLQPNVSISWLPNRIYQGGTTQTFYWGSNFSFLINHYDLSIQNDTDSLLISSQLPNSINNYNYMFPNNLNMTNARLVVDGWANDDQRIRQTSSFIFGIVPTSNGYITEPGLQMQANIWPNSVLTAPDVFGANALAWTMDTYGEWWEISPFIYGFGYWIDKDTSFEYNSSSYVQRDSLSFTLRAGWNIIPNPHLCSYKIKDLRFRINGTFYTYAEAMAQRLVSRGVFVYRESGYVQTDVILPKESFLIKYYGSLILPGYINFIPYNNGPSIEPIAPAWALKLSAFQEGSDADALEIGCNLRSSDEYDFNYDVPEPLVKPVDNLTRLYLVHEESEPGYTDLLLNVDYRSPLADSPAEEEKIWDFGLDLGNTNPVQFIIDSSLFPEHYGAAIQIGNLHYDIQHGDTFTYTPEQAGYNEGQIIVHNYFTSNQDEVMTALTNLKVFPNPFNPKANISFYLSKVGNVRVDIYNIKGQHVKRLQDGLLSKGNHQLIWEGDDDDKKITATGIYFARITAPETTRIIKMVLMK
jgi:hypothetical protein